MKLNVRVDGPKRAPVVVLLHPVGQDLTIWDLQVPPLAERFRVVRFDMRGHGASPVPAGPYTMADLAGDAIEVAESVGAERFDVCGLSTGGLVALWMARHVPERLRRLVVANAAARLGTRELWDVRIAAVKRAGMAGIIETALDRFLAPAFKSKSPEEVARLREVFLATSPAGYVAASAALRDFDARGTPGAITVPTLVIGGNTDIAAPPSDVKALAESIPGAGLALIPAAHLSNLEAPGKFTAAVMQFLAQ